MRPYNPGDLTIACYPNDPTFGVPIVDGCELVPVFGDPAHPRYPTKFIYRDAVTHSAITNPDDIAALMNKYRDMWLSGQRLRSTLEGLAYGAWGSGQWVLNTDKHIPNIWNSISVVASGAGEIVTISDPTLGDGFAEAFANCFNIGNGNTGAPTPGDGFIVIGTGSLKGFAIVRDYKTVSKSSVALLLTTYTFPEWNALQTVPESTDTPLLTLNFRVTVFPYNLMHPYTNYCVHCIDTCLNIFSSQKAILGGNMPVINVPGGGEFGGSDFICGAFASNPTGMANFALECNQTTCSHYASHHTTGGAQISQNEMAQLYYGIAGTFYLLFNYSGGWTLPKFDYNDHGLPGIYPQNGMHLWWQEDTGFGIGKHYDVWPVLRPSTVDEMYRVHYQDVDFYTDYNPIVCQKKHPLDGTDWTANGSTQRELGTADRAFDFPSVSGNEGLVSRVRDFERNTDDVVFPVTTETVFQDPELKVTITPNAGNLDFVVEESRFSEILTTPLNRSKGACLADILGVTGNVVTFLFKFGTVDISYPGVGQEGVTLKYATGGNAVQPKYLEIIWNAGSQELFGDEQVKLHPGYAIKITTAGQTIYGVCTEATAFAVEASISGNCLDNTVTQFVQGATGVPPSRGPLGANNISRDSAIVRFEPGAVELLAAATGPFNVEYYRAAVHLPETPPAITVCNLDGSVAHTVPPENLTSYFTQGKITFSVAASEIEAGAKYIKVAGKRYFSKMNTRVLESAAQYMLDLQRAIAWWTYCVASTVVPGGSVGGGGSQVFFTMAGTFQNEPQFYDGDDNYFGYWITALWNTWWSYISHDVWPDNPYWVPFNTWNWLEHIRVCEGSNPAWSSVPVILKFGGGAAGLACYGGINSIETGIQRDQTMTFPAVPIASCPPSWYYEGYQEQNKFDRIENATMTYSVGTVPATYSKTVYTNKGGLGYGHAVQNEGGGWGDWPSASADIPGNGWMNGTEGEVFTPSTVTTTYPMPDWIASIVKVTTTYRTKWVDSWGDKTEIQDDPLISIVKVHELHAVAAGESWSETITFDAGFMAGASSSVVYDFESGLIRGTDVSFYVAADCPGLDISIDGAVLPNDRGTVVFDGRIMVQNNGAYTCTEVITVTSVAAGGPSVSASWSGEYADDIIPGSQIFADPLLGQKWPNFYGSGNTHEIVPFFSSLPK